MSGRFVGSLVRPLLFVLAWPVLTTAQGNASMAGNWQLDAARSEVGRGRAGGPGPSLMILKIAPTEVTVVSDTGVNRNRETTVYRIGGAEHEVPGPMSWTSLAKAGWENGMLVVNIARIIEGPAGPVRIEMKDVYSLEGDVLTIARTQGTQTWTSVFTRP